MKILMISILLFVCTVAHAEPESNWYLYILDGYGRPGMSKPLPFKVCKFEQWVFLNGRQEDDPQIAFAKMEAEAANKEKAHALARARALQFFQRMPNAETYATEDGYAFTRHGSENYAKGCGVAPYFPMHWNGLEQVCEAPPIDPGSKIAYAECSQNARKLANH